MNIFDNNVNRLFDDLVVEIKKGSVLSIASASFSIYSFHELKKQLESIDELRFIFTSPVFVKDSIQKEKREFYIPKLERERNLYGTPFELRLRNGLTQKVVAKECAEWVKNKVKFKSNISNMQIPNFMVITSDGINKAYTPIDEFSTVSLGLEAVIEQKGSLIINQITYHKTSEKYQTDIFTNSKVNLDSSKLRLNDKCKKHVQDYLELDSDIENKLADNLEKEKIVKVYSKLPRGFKIPTPVGDYAPDWAIVFDEKEVKYIYFIAETKGSLDSLNIRKIEEIKINCAKKLYAALSSENLKYDIIKDYEGLLGIVK